MFNPAHPGEVLKEAYLDPLNISVTEFARRIGISGKCASDYVNKHADTSVEMAHRLAKATDTTPEIRPTNKRAATTSFLLRNSLSAALNCTQGLT